MKRASLFLMFLAAMIFSTSNLNAAGPKTETTAYWVSIHCTSCKQKIMDNIPFEKGVRDITIDIATKKVEVTYDPRRTNSEKIGSAIEKLGYEVRILKPGEELKAPTASVTCDRGHAPTGNASGCSGVKAPDHKCTGQKDADHKCTGQKDADHKCTGQKDANHKCTGQKDADHKCTGQKDADHKCTGQKDADHKCTGQKDADHKCCGNKDPNHTCCKQGSADKKCTGHKEGEKKETGHSCGGQKSGNTSTDTPSHKCNNSTK